MLPASILRHLETSLPDDQCHPEEYSPTIDHYDAGSVVYEAAETLTPAAGVKRSDPGAALKLYSAC